MKKIEVQDHWKIELQKLRCWLSGFNAGRKTHGVYNLDHQIPGNDVLRQIIIAIDDAKDKSK